MTLKGSSSQACAACKYQRRKCIPECPLAPYFPPDQSKTFQNAHKLFGVSNILKILKSVDPTLKSTAMNSIIYQANMRERYPVRGCTEIISQLQSQIRQSEEELHAYQTMLVACRQQQLSNPNLPIDCSSKLQLGMAPPTANNNNLLSFYDNPVTPPPPSQHPYVNTLPAAAIPISQNYSYSSSNSPYNSTAYFDSKDNIAANSMWIQQPLPENINNVMPLQAQQLIIPDEQEVFEDYEEMQPYFDTIDDRQSYVDSKDAYDSSPESSVKDTTQSTEHVAENELKSAAACFSLTSLN